MSEQPAEWDEKLLKAREAARQTAEHIAPSFYDRTADGRMDIVAILQGRDEVDMDAGNYDLLARYALSLIFDALK